MVELNGVEFGAHLAEKGFSGFAVWAVGLAKDGCVMMSASEQSDISKHKGAHTNCVVVDDTLSLGLCGGHNCWTDGAGEEETANDIYDGRLGLLINSKSYWD